MFRVSLVCILLLGFFPSRVILAQDSPNPPKKELVQRPIADAARAATALSKSLTPAQLFEKVSPAVVKIIAKDEEGRPIASGSGFIISPNPNTDSVFRRWIVTNHHVIRAAVSVITDPPFADPNPQPVFRDIGLYASVDKVVAEDQRHDLAVLAGFGTDAPTLLLGDDKPPPIGTKVFVISSPEGLKNTLSEGIVSGFRERENGEQWIQITAPISPGSSGGPVLTDDGRVIGVVVASREEGQNLNFAIPASALRRLLKLKMEPRWIWRGTSIHAEERDAFSDVQHDVFFQTCGVKYSADDCAKKLLARMESDDQLALLFRARKEYRRDSPEDCVAIATLKRAIRTKPSEYEYLAYYYLGKLTSEWRLCGPCIVHKKQFGWDEIRSRCQDPAIPLLKKSTQLNPKFSPSFARLADLYLRTDRYAEALVAAEFLVALVPNCWEAYFLRGKAFTHLGRIRSASDDFTTADELHPNRFELYDGMFDTYGDVGEYQRAFDAAARALALPLPTDEEELKTRQIHRAGLWYNMSNRYRRLGDLANEVRAYKEAHKLNPDMFPPWDIE